MRETFGEHLRNFALAVDYVSEDIFKEVLDAVDSYLHSSLQMGFFEVLTNRYFDDRVWLRTEWRTGGNHWDEPLRDDTGTLKGQVSYAFSSQRPLWIVGEDSLPLKQAQRYRDLFTGTSAEGLPRYVDLTGTEMLTSVIIPLRKPEMFGVINFEFCDYLRATPDLQRELVCIADAVASLYKLKELSLLRQENTRQAKRILMQVQQRYIVRRPTVFVAYPEKRDLEVTDAIRQVLGEFDQEVEPYFWEDEHSPGGISDRIWKEVHTCQFGVCYFSEQVQEGERTVFRDNANVLFEAGMLHAIGDNLGGKPQTWIPLREQTGHVPFDIIDQRILFVPRDENGRLLKEKFLEQFRHRLTAMLRSQRSVHRTMRGMPLLDTF